MHIVAVCSAIAGSISWSEHIGSYNALMTTQLKPDLHRKAKLLVAAVQLRKTHGLLYAMRLLEDHGFANVVIWEVLNLIPPETTKEPSQS